MSLAPRRFVWVLNVYGHRQECLCNAGYARTHGARANVIRPYERPGVHPDNRTIHAAKSHVGRYGIKNTSAALQNGLQIPLEGAFLAQGRINAPLHRQRVAAIGVDIVIIHNS